MNDKLNFSKYIFLLLLFISTVIVCTLLKLMASVMIPIAISIFIAFIFEPIIENLTKKLHIPRILAIVIVFIVLIIGIYLISQILYSSLKTIVQVIPKYEERFNYIYKKAAEFFSLSYNEENSIFANLWSQMKIRQGIQDFALSFSGGILNFFKNFVMICLFAFFFILEFKYTNKKVDLLASKVSSKQRIVRIITDVIRQVTKYISTKFFISLLTGVIVYIGLLIIGQDFPVIWAFIAFVLNFIPNFGSIISVLVTTLFALLQFWPEPFHIIFVFVWMTAVNFTVGNILEPRIQGKNLGLSPFVIIVSLSIWGWVWGFAGLVLGVPMMVILKIICENFSILQPVSVILGTPNAAKKEEKPETEKSE